MNFRILSLIAFIPIMVSTPCFSQSESSPEEYIIELSFQAPKKPKKELKELKRKSREGDGKAAFELYGYYALSVEGNVKKMNRYFARAVELEYPNALYNKAFDLWVREEKPDIERIGGLLRKAIGLGFVDERGLLDEVLEAKSSGIIPRKSKFRLFLNKESGENHTSLTTPDAARPTS